MRKPIIVFALVICLIMASVPAFAAGKATVTKESFFVRPFLSNYAAEVYAEVTNTGDKPVAFNGGLIELFNADGDSIESSNLYSCYPSILAPGESGYIYDLISVDEAEDRSYIADYALTVTGKGENEAVALRVESTGTFGEYQRSAYSSEFRLSATVHNNTDETIEDLVVAFAVFDAQDKLIYATSKTLYGVGLPAGQTVMANESVSDSIVEAWASENIAAAKIETIAFVER